MGLTYNETYLIPERIRPTVELAALLEAALAAEVIQGPFAVLAGETLPLPFSAYGVVATTLLDGEPPPRGLQVTYRGSDRVRLGLELAVPRTGDCVIRCADLAQPVMRSDPHPVFLYALAAPRTFELHLPDFDERFNELPGTAYKPFTAQHLVVIRGTGLDGPRWRPVTALRAVLAKVLGPMCERFHILH